MEQSIFRTWVDRYFQAISLQTVLTLNDTKNELTYTHLRYLTPEFSLSGKWEGLSGSFTLVSADIVEMDSSLPLKRRDSLGRSIGDIPKIGMEMKLNERQLTDLQYLIDTNQNNNNLAPIVRTLFSDTKKVIGGVYEALEKMFLEGLSTGLTVIDDSENVGKSIRLDYKYLTANKFGTAVVWATAATAKPFDDLQQIIDKAALDGNRVTKFFMDLYAFRNFVKTTQAKELYGVAAGFFGDMSKIPSLSVTQAQTAIADRFPGVTIEIIDRAIRNEKNGVQTVVKPWQEGMVVAVCSDRIGTLVYSRLAEEAHPVAGVNYEKVQNYILVSKFRQNKPSLGEFTNSQARVVPVIGNVDQIYTLDSKAVTA